MKKNIVVIVITTFIAVLFFYAATSKLMDYEKSKWQMHNQVFPENVADIMTWLIPVIELILMLALLFPFTRVKALWASLFLLFSFSLYIFLGMNNVFSRKPCGCGGILGENTSYLTHLIFNLCFVVAALTGLTVEYYQWIKNICLTLNERRSSPKVE